MVGSGAIKPSPLFIVCTIALAGFVTTYILLKPKKAKVNRKKLPPAVPFSGFEIIKKLTNGKNHRFTMEMRNLLGPVFSVNILGAPLPLIVVTDPLFIRKITDGDESLSMPASEKTHRYKKLNAITFGTPNILTKRTHGEGWDWARKGIAPSFSISNLVKRLPELQQKLKIFTEVLETHYVGEKKILEDVSSWMLNVTVDFLSSSMFGIDFDTLGTRLQKQAGGGGGGEGNGNKRKTIGSDFLDNMSLALKEFGYKRVINPFRKYMFWNEDARKAIRARKRVGEVATDVVKNYRSTHSLEETERDTSILAQLVRR
jgi:cytochrome P450